MKIRWSASALHGILIFSLVWPGSLMASPQGKPAEQQQKSEGSQTKAPDRASQPSAPAQPQEEYIEVERETPFGTQHFRVPKSVANQPAAQGQPSGAGSVQPVQPPPSNPVPPGIAAQVPQQPAQQPPVAATPPAPGTQDNPTVPIALHLENAELSQVIGIIAAELKMNYLVDPQVKGSVNINTLGEVHRSDLFPLLQMILRINGATAVQTGNFFRIVPLKDVQRLPMDPLSTSDARSLPSDDRMVMDIIPLKYVSAPDMTKILTPFLSEGGHLFSHDAGNILLITDSSRSMKRLLELIGIFDTEVFTNQRARIYQVKNSQANRLADELKQIFSAYALSSENSAIRFVPIERINSVLVVTANPNAYSEVEKWLDKLDQPQQESGIRNFIYKVENGKASDITNVLNQLLGLQPSSQLTIAGARGPGGSAPQGVLPPPAQVPTAAQAQLSASGDTGASRIRIVPDLINNQIVVQCTTQEYEQIRRTIRDLDVIPRQVMIEAKVYEVDLTGDLSAGVTAFLQNRDNLERKPLASFAGGAIGQAATSAESLAASVGTLVGKTRELMLFLNAQESRSRARVISAPSILASDNLPANIDVGTQIPVLTSTAASGAQISGSTVFAQTIQNEDTGVLLTITPRINSSGLVNLQIQQEVSSPLPPTGPIASPSIQKRTISTQVVVQDGETLALGGIIQENRQLLKNRIPLLGDIPYIGALFGTTSLNTQRTELIILLTPTVIRNLSEAQAATMELRDRLKDLRSIIEDDQRKEEEREKTKKARSQSSVTPGNPSVERRD